MDKLDMIDKMARDAGISRDEARKSLESFLESVEVALESSSSGSSPDKYPSSVSRYSTDEEEPVSQFSEPAAMPFQISGSNKYVHGRFQKLSAGKNLLETYFSVKENANDSGAIKKLVDTVGLNDDILADWLGITTRTLKNYRENKNVILKIRIREHIVLILSLYKHGRSVFGSTKGFENWLTQKNILLDNLPPSDFLETVSGINFIDNRLTAMDFGENV